MRKVLCIILSLAMLCSSVPVFADAAEAVQSEAEENVVSSPYFKLFKDLGLLSLEKEQKYISRIDFTEIISKAYGSGELFTADTVFSDVKSDDKKSGYVKFAADSGFIKGYSDATFRPYDNLTYYEAITTIVRVLGYEKYADQQGGYPVGYIVAAQRIHILSGLSFDNGDEPIELYDLLGMMHDALDVQLMDMSAMTNGETEYEVIDGTLLSEKMDIYTLEGKITETYLSSLSGKSSLDRGAVRVDKNIYKTGIELVEQLGKEMTFYIKDGSSQGEIVGVVENEEQREIIIDDFRLGSVSDKQIEYSDENGKLERIRVSGSTDFVKNGLVKVEWSINELMADDAYIRILDNDNDGYCDVIFLESYNNYTLKRIDSENNVLFLSRVSASSNLTLDDSKKYIIKDKDGSEILISDLVVGDLLSISESEDSSVYIIHRSADKVSGTVNSITADTKMVKLDDVWHRYASDAYDTLKIGSSGVFALDFRDKLSCESDYTNAAQYGYLVKLAIEGGMLDRVRAKIFTADGEMKIFELADDVLVDDSKVSAADAYTGLSGEIDQVITYSCNGDGKINKIDIAINGEGLSAAERLGIFSRDAFINEDGIYWRNSNMFGHKFRINDTSVIFDIPSDRTKEDEYSVLKMTDLAVDQRYVNVSFYDTDADYCAGAVSLSLVTGDRMSYTSPSGVITAISACLGEEGEELTKITLMNAGDVKDILVDPEDVTILSGSAISDGTKDPVAESGVMPVNIAAGALEIGDVLQYVVFDSATNLVKLAKVMFRGNYPPSTNFEYSNGVKTKWNVYAPIYNMYARVKEAVDGALVVEIPFEGSTVERVLSIGAADKIIRINRERSSAAVITAGMINPEDEVFMFIRYGTNRTVVTYE